MQQKYNKKVNSPIKSDVYDWRGGFGRRPEQLHMQGALLNFWGKDEILLFFVWVF
jgi:hypothetical protein